MPLWKGRFRQPLDAEALEFSTSLHVDRRLYREDIEGSLAHVGMLAKQKILTAREGARIRRALIGILREIETGAYRPGSTALGRGGRFTAEDIHMAIEGRLIAKIGKIGGKLHTGRSRNDQVALDERLYLVREGTAVASMVRLLQRSLLSLAKANRDVLMPGYTHLQRAQPVLLAHHLLAYVSMFDRDHGRFVDCLRRARRSPLGAAALAGTSFPIHRQRVAAALRLDGIVENSIDAVSDRDGLIEFIGACALTMMHLSRVAEELVLWSSQEWHFIEIGDEFTTGSSIMPQKKNPDMAELVRGKAGRVYGDLVALLTVMKGLPLAYNRDLQEDKEPLFDAADTTRQSLRITARMLGTIRFNADRFPDEMAGDFLLATELADYLVRKGIPFREAHEVIGVIVGECSRRGISLRQLPLQEYQRRSKAFGSDLYSILEPSASIRLKRSAGSTSPKEVGKALRIWERRLKGRVPSPRK
jgi:argininosuccinate lyase